MITICLDESGSFEGEGSAVRFIGGVVFKSSASSGEEVNSDIKAEELKIEEFLKGKCQELGLEYPRGIHAMDMNDASKKYKLKEALKEYLRSSGSYYLTLIIKGREEKSIYKNTSNVVSDDVASNLYEHMICNLIDNILFYNLNFKDEKEAVLEIATRAIPIPKKNAEEIAKYKKLGYNFNEYGSDMIFYLTDQRTFKSAISTKMIEDKIEKDINLEFNVQSINYHRTDKDKLRDNTPWLYLADLVCDIMRDYINARKRDLGVEALSEEARRLTGNDTLIFAYDDIDSLWGEIFEGYLDGDYINCLKELYKAMEVASDFLKFYYSNWIGPLEEKIEGLFNIEELDNYVYEVRRLLAKDTTHSEENVKDNNLGLFIGERLWSCLEKSTLESREMTTRYKLADLMLMGYNHRGNIERAKEFFDICMSMRNVVSPEDYCGTLLSAAQISVNQFDFDGAIKNINRGVEFVEYLKKSQSEVKALFGEGLNQNYKYPLLGKMYSSLGQFYSYKRDKEEALKYFEAALEEFSNDLRNRDMTLSFLMHLALDCGDRELYEKYSPEYLSSTSLMEQLNYIFKRYDRYKLYVFVKSLNTFYLSPEAEILDAIKECNWDEEAFLTAQHPWQLIFKHTSMLFYRCGDRDEGRKFKDRIKDVVREERGDLTLKIISLYAELKVLYECEKNIKMAQARIEDFKRIIKSNDKLSRYFEECFIQKNLDEIMEGLKAKINYNYA